MESSFQILPSIQELFSYNIEQYQLPSPLKFQENEIDGLFINNAGGIFSSWLMLIIVYGFVKFVLYYSKKKRKRRSNSYWKKVMSNLEWSGFIRNFMASYFESCLFSVLQLKHIWPDQEIQKFSAFLAMVVFIFNVVSLYLGTLLIPKVQRLHYSQAKKFIALIEHLKYRPMIARYLNLITLFKRLVNAIILVLLHDSPAILIGLLMILDLSYFIFILIVKPHTQSKERLMTLADDAISFIIYLLILILNAMNLQGASKDAKSNLGWMVIGCCITGMFISCIYVCIESWSSWKETWKKVKQRLFNKKEIAQLPIHQTRKVKRPNVKAKAEMKNQHSSDSNASKTEKNKHSPSIKHLDKLEKSDRVHHKVAVQRMVKRPAQMMIQK